MTDATQDLMAALEGEEVTAPIADPDGSTIDAVTEWVAQVVRLNAREAEYVEAHKNGRGQVDRSQDRSGSPPSRSSAAT